MLRAGPAARNYYRSRAQALATEVQSDSLQKHLQSKGWLVQTPTVQRHESRPSPHTPLFLKQPLPSGNSPDQHTAGAKQPVAQEQLAWLLSPHRLLLPFISPGSHLLRLPSRLRWKLLLWYWLPPHITRPCLGHSFCKYPRAPNPAPSYGCQGDQRKQNSEACP